MNNLKKQIKKSMAQGTIEYLVILAVVVVIGLVVVSLSVGFFDSAGDISATTRDIGRVTSSGIVVTEVVVDSDGNILLNLRNQTGQVLTLTGVDAEGTSSNYENRLTTNQEILLKAFSENCKCTPGQTTTTCEIQLTYDTQIPNRTDPKILIELECIEQIEPTVPPVEPLFAGLCGEAINQESFYETPENDLCEIGSPGTITYNIEDGNWEWACIGSTQTLTDNCSVSRDVGDGSEEKPKILFTCQDLQDMNQNLDWHYTLGNNIDCSEFNGFEPIGYKFGNDYDEFIGSFNGQGYKILNLTINKSDEDDRYIGLFAYSIGEIKNISLEDIEVVGAWYVGSLVGYQSSDGIISNSYSTGNVQGSINSVGGLVGYSTGNISNSSFTGVVSGFWHVGGLVGYSTGNISNSYSTGNVEGSEDNIGGLVGYSTGNISNSHSTGNVHGSINNVGGLVGRQNKVEVFLILTQQEM